MSKAFWKAAAIRAIRTFAQSMLAYMGSSAITVGDVNWIGALSAGLLGSVVSILMALAGLPEVENDVD